MKRMFLGVSVVAAALLTASAAMAGGVNLAWNNCASEGGVPTKTSTCSANTGSNALVGSFQPHANISGVTGIEVVLDFIVGDGVSAIPPWWEISGTGACRSTALSVNGIVNPANATCVDWASGAGVGGLAAFQSTGDWSIQPINEPAHRRAIIGIAVPANAAADLLATQEYFAFNALISNAKTVGTGACAGCSTPACIVFNSINVVAGTSSNQFIGSGVAPGSNFASYQAGAPSCALVPTKTRTWSAVKSMYR